MVDRLSSGQIDLIELLAGQGESIALAGAEHPPGEGLSYRRLAQAADGWVERFRAYGLTPGSRITVQTENSTVLVAFLYGVWCAGLFPLILTPLLPVGRVRELATELRCGPPFTAGDLDLPAGGASADPVDPDAPATALLTSGSTGMPRAVVHTLANHLYSAIGSAANLPLERDDRWLMALPLSHVAGLSILFRCLLAGATALIARSGSFREDDRGPGDALALLPRATRLSVVPAQLQRLIEVPQDRRGSAAQRARRRTGGGTGAAGESARGRHPGAAHLRLHRDGLAGGHRHPRRRPAARRERPRAAAPATAHPRRPDRGRRRNAVRRLSEPGRHRAAADRTGRVVPDGRLRPPGRQRHPDRHRPRRRDVHLGRENIHPQEIEEVLGAHPAVAVAVVVPAPDPEFGARPVAFIDSHGSFPPEDEVQALLSERLPRYQHPVRYYPMPAGALTPLGKPDRARLTGLARERPRS